MKATDIKTLRQSPAMDGSPAHQSVKSLKWVMLLLAFTCGLSVASIYYAQPLLEAMGETFGLNIIAIGLVVTVTQIGYAVGLIFIVPAGDLVDRRKLILCQTALSGLALFIVGTAPSEIVFFGGMMMVGLLAVVVQVLVATAAALAPPEQRGQAVGIVTSGVVVGILAARLFAGIVADLGGWRAVYLAAAGLMWAMTLILFRVLPAAAVATSQRYGQVLKSVLLLFLREPLLRVRAGLAFLIFASFSTLWTAMVLPLSGEPFLLSHTQIGLFGLAGLFGAVAASKAGRLADQGRALWTTGVSLVVLTSSWFLIDCLPKSLVSFTIGVVLLDFAVQAVHVTNQSLILAVRPEARSRLVGGYMVFYSAGSALGAIASTVVYASFGWSGVSTLGAAFSFAALLLWAATRKTG